MTRRWPLALALVAGTAVAQTPPPNPFLQPLPPPPPLEGMPPQLSTPSPTPDPPMPRTFTPYAPVPVAIDLPHDVPASIPLPPVTPALMGLLAYAPPDPEPLPPADAPPPAAGEPIEPDGPTATLPSAPTPVAEPSAPQLIAIVTGERPLAIVEYAGQRHRVHPHDTLPDGSEVVAIGTDHIELQRGGAATRLTFP
jgi:hypothetical protein